MSARLTRRKGHPGTGRPPFPTAALSRADHDASLVLVRCDRCGVVQGNRAGPHPPTVNPCRYCDGLTGTYA